MLQPQACSEGEGLTGVQTSLTAVPSLYQRVGLCCTKYQLVSLKLSHGNELDSFRALLNFNAYI